MALGTAPQSVGAFDMDRVVRKMYSDETITAGTVYQILQETVDPVSGDFTTIEGVDDLISGIYCVALESAAAGNTVSVCFKGQVTALGGLGDPGVGEMCSLEAGGSLIPMAVGSKVVAKCGGAIVLDQALGVFQFNGIEGMGSFDAA